MIEIFIYILSTNKWAYRKLRLDFFYPTFGALDLNGISLISAQNSGGHQLFFGAFHSYHLY